MHGKVRQEPDIKATLLKSSNTSNIGAAIGYIYSKKIRFDLNLSYLPEWRASTNSSSVPGLPLSYHAKLSSFVTSFNGYYDFNCILSQISPYLTAGVGIAHNTIKDVDIFIDQEFAGKRYGNSKYDLVVKLGAGLNYFLSDKAQIGLGYRFLRLGNFAAKTGYRVGMADDQFFPTYRFKQDVTIFKNIHTHQILLSIIIAL
jgi:opacity protein-like surface antigen